ncbi:MAP3K12-binding inhibitory protein 1 [Lissotriton helveticus]
MEAEAAERGVLGATLRALEGCARELHLPEDVVTLAVNWTKLKDVPVPPPALLSRALQQHIQHMQSFLDKLKAFVNVEEACPAEDVRRPTHGDPCVKSADPTEGNGGETPGGGLCGPADGSHPTKTLAEGSHRADLCAESEENTQGRKPEDLKEAGSTTIECPAEECSRPESGVGSGKSAEVLERSKAASPGHEDRKDALECPAEDCSRPESEVGSGKSAEVMERSKAASPGHEDRKVALECPAEDASRTDSEDSATRSAEIHEKVPQEPTDMQIDMECPAEDVDKTASENDSTKSAGTTEGKSTEINEKVHVSPCGEQDTMTCPAEGASGTHAMECHATEGGGPDSEEKIPPGPSNMRDSLECLDDASQRNIRAASAMSAEATIESNTESCKRVSCGPTDGGDAMEWSTVGTNEPSPKKAETTEGSRAETSEEAAAAGPPGTSGAMAASLRFDQEVVQIKAQKAEIDRRIMAFIERKQAEINKNNVREFCNVIDCNQENSCARTDAVFTPYPGFRSHVKVSRVVNTYGPQTRPDLTSTSTTKAGTLSRDCGNQAVEERLQNIETHLRLQSGGPVPKDIYMRLQKLEEKILELEGLSPEYFQTASFPGKRRKTQAAQSCSLVELDEKISALREKLVRKANSSSSRDGDKLRV